MSSFAALMLAAAVAAGPEVKTTDFQGELRAVLDASLTAKKGIVFHVQGSTIPGYVRQVLSDAVVVANQQHGRIVIRFDRIDAVEAD
jgi:hypothetical protein